MQTKIFKDLENHSKNYLSLIASESWFPAEHKLPYLLDLFHRYSFDIEKKEQNLKFYGRIELVKLEKKCNSKLQKLMNAKFSSVKAVSGLNMMISVIGSFNLKGDTILSMPIKHGGHGATEHICKRLSLNHIFLPFKHNEWTIDDIKLKEILEENKVKMIYIDLMNVITPVDLNRLRKIVDNSKVIICYDASHVLGLIMGNQFQNPLNEGADIVIGTTHKTFPGPHKGIFVTNNRLHYMFYNLLFDMYISNHHLGDVGTLLSVLNYEKDWFIDYAQMIIKCANALALTLERNGIKVLRADNNTFTYSHQIFVELNRDDYIDIYNKLLNYGVITNLIKMPLTSLDGLRIGVQELCFKDFTEEDFILLGEVISNIIHRGTLNAKQMGKIKALKEKSNQPVVQGVKNLIENLYEIYGDDIR